ncbi:hypothetical protein L596_007045 [Steinernema carpocapsae]|uniref:Carboxylesterase type B domain-containing protein n=1 Tax=Steinernema carpocapsae TaxID=34508 RepID=A0A4U5P7Z9_STECR|nr:hypothetical protein L596_007045 [Steinernema carpocapsae]
MLSKCGFVFVFFWSTALGLSPIVETPFGTVEGFEYESARVFLGIRFAEPPVGSRRFEKPGNVKKWTGVLRAKKFGPSCYSTIASGPWSDFEYSEDCLSLNIIAPKENKPEGYPVVFFVHGGGFEFDTATLLGYKKIENNFVSQGIVFVTFNYRLGPFGFLTTENDLLPGNLGLWDQSAALQFVHEVISSFGGNPSRITAMGESAGGISVSALTLCEHTRDFIQKAIQISGSSYMIPLAGQDKFGLQFLAEIGCLSEDSGELKKCLKAKTRQEIMETEAYLAPPLSSDKPIGGRYFPYIDRDFFRADLQTLAKASRPIPTMIGMNQVEAAVFVFSTENASYIEVPPSEYSSYSAEDLKKSLEKIASNISDLAPLLERFYLNQGSNISQDSVFFLTQLVNVASDIAFVLPSFQELLEKMRLNWPVHLFVEEFYNDCEQRRAMIRVPGSSHANELPFLFDNPPMFPTSDEESSEKFRRNMVEGFVSFVKSR